MSMYNMTQLNISMRVKSVVEGTPIYLVIQAIHLLRLKVYLHVTTCNYMYIVALTNPKQNKKKF